MDGISRRLGYRHRRFERLPDFGEEARPLQGQVLFVAAQNVLSGLENKKPERRIREKQGN